MCDGPELPRPECSARGQGQRLGSPAGMGPCDGDRREAGQLGGSSPTAQGWAPPFSVLLSDSEAARCVWLGFSLALSDQVGGGGKKKERKRSNFSSPQLPWVCAANCHCETSIVRLSLPRSSRGSARGQGLHRHDSN